MVLVIHATPVMTERGWAAGGRREKGGEGGRSVGREGKGEGEEVGREGKEGGRKSKNVNAHYKCYKCNL